MLSIATDLFDDIHFLDLFELQWTELRPGLVHGSPPSPRICAELAGGTGWGDKIYFLGGSVQVDSTSSDVPFIEPGEQVAVHNRT